MGNDNLLNDSTDLPKAIMQVFEGWENLNNGKITGAEFQQMLSQLRDTYLANFDQTKSPDRELLWKQYEPHTDLYKHYLEMVLKYNAFYYAVTGAILSFYFTKSEIPLVKYAMLLPILMSLIFGVLFVFAGVLNRVTRNDIFRLRDELNLETAPEMNILGATLAVSALLMLTVASLILWFFFPSLILPAVVFCLFISLLLWFLFR